MRAGVASAAGGGPEGAARGEEAGGGGEPDEVAGGAGAAGEADGGADVAAGEQAGAIGGALAGGEVAGGVEGRVARDALGETAAEQERDRAAEALGLARDGGVGSFVVGVEQRPAQGLGEVREAIGGDAGGEAAVDARELDGTAEMEP